MIQHFLREAIEQWSIKAGSDVTSKTISLVADQLSYRLNDSFINVIQVIDDLYDIPLTPTTVWELYDTQGFGHNRAWRDVRSTRPTFYVQFSLDEFWFWPTLSTVAATNTVTVTYNRAVDDDIHFTSTNRSDRPSVPEEYHYLLVDYVVGRLGMLNARGDRLARNVELAKRWIDALDGMNDRRLAAGHEFVITQAPILNR